MNPSDDTKIWKILMVGVDDAGKTQILYKLKTGETVKTIPTLGYNVEEVEYKDSAFKIWDIGGKNTIRVLWRYYCENRQGIIFVVDSSQVERMDECKKYLMDVLAEDDLKDAILLVLANKQDLPNVMNVTEITEKLDLNSVKNRMWHIQATCALNGDGLNESFDWFSNQLKNTVVKETVVGENVVEETVVGEIVVGETVVEETVVGEIVVGEIVVEETVVEKSVVEEIVVETPIN